MPKAKSKLRSSGQGRGRGSRGGRVNRRSRDASVGTEKSIASGSPTKRQKKASATVSSPPPETDIQAERPIPTVVGSRSSFQLPEEGETQGQPGESWPLLTPQSVDAPPSMPHFSQPGLPAMRCSISEQLGSNVPLSMRERIWKGEFVELGHLLKGGSPTCSDMTLTLDQASGGFQLRPQSRPIAIRSIEQWTSAMLIYLSIFAERHNERCREVLKYMSVVRTAAASNYNWREYDVQFRLRHATQPELSWAVVDTELWLLVATAQPFRAFAGGPYTTQGFSRGGRQRQLTFRGGWSSGQRRGGGQSTNRHGPRLGLCFAFNASRCSKGKSCQYRHNCNHCGDASHGETACPKVQRPQANRVLAPTPVKLDRMLPFLITYENQSEGQKLIEGFTNGFPLGFAGEKSAYVSPEFKICL
nr:uncharacterized protein LOC129263623 [Lytechinus pictus]